MAALRSPAVLCPLQELEQQLMMEKRNYRKTLKFYQKLLQKEKRSKGGAVRAGPARGWHRGPTGRGRRVLTLPCPQALRSRRCCPN